MMKKLFLITLGVAIVVSTLAFVWFRSASSNDERLSAASLALASAVIDLRRGESQLSALQSNYPDVLSDKVLATFSQFESDLKDLNKLEFDVTAFYEENFKNREIDPEIVGGNSSDNPDGSSENLTSYNKAVSLEQDPRIFSRDGRDYMLVNDFVFSTSGRDIVTYKDVNMVVMEDSVPETYDMILKNPEHLYNFVSSSEGVKNSQKYIDFIFKSVNSGNSVLVRVIQEDGKIVDFKELR